MGSAAAAGAEALAAVATSPHDLPGPGPCWDGSGGLGLGPASSSPSHLASSSCDADDSRVRSPDPHNACSLTDRQDPTGGDLAQLQLHSSSSTQPCAPPIVHSFRSPQPQLPTGVAGQSPHVQQPLTVNKRASQKPKGSAGRLLEENADREGPEPALGDVAPPPQLEGLGKRELPPAPLAESTSSSPRAPEAGPALTRALHHLVPGPLAALWPTLAPGAAGRAGPGRTRPNDPTPLRRSDMPNTLALPTLPAAAIHSPSCPRSFPTSSFPCPCSPRPGRSSGSSCIGLGPLGSSSLFLCSSLCSRGGHPRPPLLRPRIPPSAAPCFQEVLATWATRATCLP